VSNIENNRLMRKKERERDVEERREN